MRRLKMLSERKYGQPSPADRGANAMREMIRAQALETLKAHGCTCTPVISVDPAVDLTTARGAAPVSVIHLGDCQFD